MDLFSSVYWLPVSYETHLSLSYEIWVQSYSVQHWNAVAWWLPDFISALPRVTSLHSAMTWPLWCHDDPLLCISLCWERWQSAYAPSPMFSSIPPPTNHIDPYHDCTNFDLALGTRLCDDAQFWSQPLRTALDLFSFAHYQCHHPSVSLVWLYSRFLVWLTVTHISVAWIGWSLVFPPFIGLSYLLWLSCLQQTPFLHVDKRSSMLNPIPQRFYIFSSSQYKNKIFMSFTEHHPAYAFGVAFVIGHLDLCLSSLGSAIWI